MNTPSESLTPQHQETWKFISASPHRYLLRFWDQLQTAQRIQLLDQLAKIDFQRIAKLHPSQGNAEVGAQIANAAEAPGLLIPPDIRQTDPDRFKLAETAGWEALRAGRVGVILVAGGEGTRLGFPHPKGKFPIGPVTGKTLYQLLAEQVVAISQRCKATIPYYVMTSDATHDETADFFKEHHCFGLQPENIYFFRQGKMPAVDQKSGRILLAAPDSLALSPDGHGGLIDAMNDAGLFEDMRMRGLELLFYHQVDNPLVRVCDPVFIGFHQLHQADVSTKVVAKEDPAEKVGLLVEVAGRHQMIEYVDLPEDLAKQRDATGLLRLRCGNIAVHLFRCDFLERIAQTSDGLPFHRSAKSVPHVDDAGQTVEPEKSNAFKFERFIFDILPEAQRPLAMEVLREQEFVPLKNREGEFSPEFVQTAIRRLHTSWLKKAGWTNEEELSVEIQAAFALTEDDFAEAVRRVPSQLT